MADDTVIGIKLTSGMSWISAGVAPLRVAMMPGGGGCG